MKPAIVPLILCGGSGTQLWLLSRSTYIPIGEVHRLRNPGKVELETFKV